MNVENMNPTAPPTRRTFQPLDAVQFSDDKATVVELVVTGYSSIAVWGVRPGQEVRAHTHPDGQDTWVMLRGELTYYLGDGRKQTIRSGQFDVAEPNQVHGACNEGKEDTVFLAIYSAPKLGWEAAHP